MAPEVYITFGDTNPTRGKLAVITGLHFGQYFNGVAACTDVVILKKKPQLGFTGQGGRQAMSRRRLRTSAESFGASR